MPISKTNHEIKNYTLMTLGAILIAISVVAFFKPNGFTTGGTPGLAILLSHLTNFSIGSMVIAINVPLLIFGVKYLGKSFAIRTVIAIFLISFFIDIFSYIDITPPTYNILLASIFGGAIIGFGVGLIIKANSSAGGSTIVARIVSANSHIKPAQVILFIDVIIVLCSIYVFADIEKALYSIMSIYITAKAIDVVLTGALSTKVIHITSAKAQSLSDEISKALNVEGTILKGLNFNQDRQKEIILLVLDVKRLALLKDIVMEHDEEAFMIVMEASEMLGRGH